MILYSAPHWNSLRYGSDPLSLMPDPTPNSLHAALAVRAPLDFLIPDQRVGGESEMKMTS